MENQPADNSVNLEFHDQTIPQDSSQDIFDLGGLIPTTNLTPNWNPVRFSQQFIVYNNRLYFYDVDNHQWLHTQYAGVTTLTDAATIATDASLGNYFRVTLGGNRTLGNPTNAVDGQRLTFEIIQDNTGSRTLALGTKFALGTDITSTTLTTTANKRDFLGVIYNASADKFYVVSFIKGF